jgi:hypothetical protein
MQGLSVPLNSLRLPATVAGWTIIRQKGLVPTQSRLRRVDSELQSGMLRQEEIICGNAIMRMLIL